MEYNKESFKKALKECGIIRWENHFEKVVKAYLKAETEQLTILVVSHQRELLSQYNSFVNMQYNGVSLDDADIDDFRDWLNCG